MLKKATSIILILLIELLATQSVLGPIVDVVKASNTGATTTEVITTRDTCTQNAKTVLLEGKELSALDANSDQVGSSTGSGNTSTGTEEDITNDESYDRNGADMPFEQVFDINAIRKMHNEGVVITQKDDNGAIFPPQVSTSNNPIIDQINRNIYAVLKYNSNAVYVYSGMDDNQKTINDPAKEYIVVCNSGALIDPQLFDAFIPTSLDYVDLLSIMADPNPKITFANKNDYYALVGEKCSGGFLAEADRPQSGPQAGNPCPSNPDDIAPVVDEKTNDVIDVGSKDNPAVTVRFNQEDDINGNGLWDAPKVDYRVVQSLIYLVTPADYGGAGREHIRIKKLAATSSDDELTVKPDTSTSSSTDSSGSSGGQSSISSKDSTVVSSYLQVEDQSSTASNSDNSTNVKNATAELSSDEKNSELKKYFGVEIVKAADGDSTNTSTVNSSTTASTITDDVDVNLGENDTTGVDVEDADSAASSASSDDGSSAVSSDAANQTKATVPDINESKHLIEGPAFKPTKISTAVQIDEIDEARITTQIIKKRLFGNNSYEYKYQSPFPIKVAWQTQKGITSTPAPEYAGLNMLGLARVNTNIAVIQMLNAYGLGDLEINAADADVDSLGDAALLVGQSLFEQLIGTPNGSLKGWDLESTLESIGLAYIEQEMGLVNGALGSADEDPIEELSYEDTVNTIGRVTLESLMGLPRGSLKSASGKSAEILTTLGNRFLEKQVFQVTEGTLEASTIVRKNGAQTKIDIKTVNDLLERLGEGRMEKVFGLPKQSLRALDYETFRNSSYKAKLLFPKQNTNPSDSDHDLSEWVSDQLKLSYVGVQKYQTNTDGSIIYDANGKPKTVAEGDAKENSYGFTKYDFEGTSALYGGPLIQLERNAYDNPTGDEALAKFKRLVGSKVIENSVGIFQATGASDRISVDDSLQYPNGYIKAVTHSNGSYSVEECSAAENQSNPNVCKPRQKILPVQFDSDNAWCSDSARLRQGFFGSSHISCSTSNTQGHEDELLTQIYNLFNNESLLSDYAFKQPDENDENNKLPTRAGDSTTDWINYNTALELYYARNMVWTGEKPVNGVNPIQPTSSDGLMTDPNNPTNTDGTTHRIPITKLPIISNKTFINNSANNGLIKDYGNGYMMRYDMMLRLQEAEKDLSFYDLSKLKDANGNALSGSALDNELIKRLNTIIAYPTTVEEYNSSNYEDLSLNNNGWLYTLKDLQARNSCMMRGGTYDVTNDSKGKLVTSCKTNSNTNTDKNYDTNQEVNGFTQINATLTNLEEQFTSFRDALLEMLDGGGNSGDSALGKGNGQSMMSAAIGLPGQAVHFDKNGKIEGTGLSDTSYTADPLRAIIAPKYMANGVVDRTAEVKDMARNIRNIGIQYLATRFTDDPLTQRTFLYQVTKDLNGMTQAVNSLAEASDSLFNLGLSENMLEEKGLKEGDFERIFRMDLGDEVFERIGKEELYRAIWNYSNAGDAIKSSSSYSALISELNAATKDVNFYHNKIDLLQKQIDKLQTDYDSSEDKYNTYSKAFKEFFDKLQEVNSTQVNGKGTNAGARVSNNFKYIQQAMREVEPTAKKMGEVIKNCKAEDPNKCPITQLEKDLSDIKHTLQEIAAGRDLPNESWSTKSTKSSSSSSSKNKSKNACFNLEEAKQVILKGKGSPPTTTIEIKNAKDAWKSITGVQDLLVDYAGYVGSCNLDKGLLLPKGTVFIWYKLGTERYIPNPYLEAQDATAEYQDIIKELNKLKSLSDALVRANKDACVAQGNTNCDFTQNNKLINTYARKISSLEKKAAYAQKAINIEGNEAVRWYDMQGGGSDSPDDSGGSAASSDPAATATASATNDPAVSNLIDLTTMKAKGNWIAKVFGGEEGIGDYADSGYTANNIQEKYRNLMWGKNSWNAQNLALAIGLATAMNKGELKITDVDLYYLIDPDKLVDYMHVGQKRMQGALSAYLAKALMPQLGGVMKEYQLTTDDLISLLQGNTRPVTEKIGGKIIDNALGLNAGTGAQLLYPKCKTLTGADGPCNRDPNNPMSDPDNIRLKLLAQEGFSKLGLDLPGFPETFDMTTSGNMLSNLGNAGISEGLGLAVNSFSGNINDTASAIRAQKSASTPGSPSDADYYINNFDIIYPKLMRAFGLSENPFTTQLSSILKSTEKMVSETYGPNIDGQQVYENAFSALSKSYRTIIEEYYRKRVIERLYTKENFSYNGVEQNDYLYWQSSSTEEAGLTDAKAATLAGDNAVGYFDQALPAMWQALNQFINSLNGVIVQEGNNQEDKKADFIKKLRALILDGSGQIDASKRTDTFDATYSQLIGSDTSSTLTDDSTEKENLLYNASLYYLVENAPGPNQYKTYIYRLNDRVKFLDTKFRLADGLFKDFLQGKRNADQLANTTATSYYLTDVLGRKADDWIETSGPDWLKDVNKGLKLLTKGQYDINRQTAEYNRSAGIDYSYVPSVWDMDPCKEGMGIGQMLSESIFSTSSSSSKLCGMDRLTGSNLLYSPQETAFRLFFFDTVMARTFSNELENDLGIKNGTFRTIAANPRRAPQIMLGQAIEKVADQTFGNRSYSDSCGLDRKMCFQNNLRGMLREAFLAGYYDPDYIDPNDPKNRGGYTTSFNGDRSLKKLKQTSRRWLDAEMRRMGRKYLNVEITTSDVDLFLRGDGRFYSMVALQYTVNSLNDSLDRNSQTKSHPNKEKFKISYQDVRGTVGLTYINESDYRSIVAQADQEYKTQYCAANDSGCDARKVAINQFINEMNNGNQDASKNGTLSTALIIADKDKDGKLSDSEKAILTANDNELIGKVIDREKLSSENTAKKAAAVKAKKDAENRLRYKTIDLGAFQLDHNIPVNFSQRLFEGNKMDKSGAVGEYVFNSWADNDQEFRKFCQRYGLSSEVVGSFVGKLLTATFETGSSRANDLNAVYQQFFTGGLASSLDRAFSDWVSEQLFNGKDVPSGMLTGLVTWLVSAHGDWDKFNSDVCITGSGENCTKVPALGKVLLTFTRTQFESWVDKQCGWKSGTATLVTQSLIAMYKLYEVKNASLNSLHFLTSDGSTTTVVSGSELQDGSQFKTRGNSTEYKKAAAEAYQAVKLVIMAAGDKTFQKFDAQLGLPSGMTSQIVGLGLDFLAASMHLIDLGPWGIGMAVAGLLATAIWGVVKVKVTTLASTDGYYPFYKYGNSGMKGRSNPPTPPYPEHVSKDELTGTFDPTNSNSYAQGLIKGAQAKVLGFLKDIAAMPGSQWAKDHGLSAKEFRVSQVFTYGDEDYSPLSDAALQAILREKTPWDAEPGIGFGNYGDEGCYDLVNGVLEQDGYEYTDPETGETITQEPIYKTACLNSQEPIAGFFSTDKIRDAIYIAW